MSDFNAFIQELKERCDLVDVITSFGVKLERRGYNFWACCPFHHEKTPSFSVNAADKFYHCFGCGVSGDVIGFVRAYENLDFMQAVQLLAARVGLEVPARDERAAEEAAAKKKVRDRLTALMRTAARFYLNNLYSGRAQAHMDYIAKRKLLPSTVKKFGLGASLDYGGLPSHLLAQGFTAEECVEAGACVRTEEGRLIDAQGERLIIPIINNLDEVIAFGGRVLKPTDRAKYKNTRETVLFNKRKNLYNINLVKKEKRAGGLPYLIMVEGYMDVISLYQAGFRTAVASMGTSLTKEQARLAKRYSDTVYISYDGDFAGQSANLRGLEILRAEGLNLRVVPLPDGLDPDDVIKERGEAGYKACLDNAMPLIDFRLLAAEKKYDLSKSEERRAFVKEALAVIAEAENNTEKEELLKRVSARSGVSLSALSGDLERAAKEPEKPAFKAPPPAEEAADGEKKAARFVLAACLLSKPYAEHADLSAYDFPDEEHRLIAAYIHREQKSGKVRPAGIFDLVQTDGELSEILNLNTGETLDGSEAEQYFKDCLVILERGTLGRLIARERRRYAETENTEERRECLLKINEYTKRLKK